jgi:hypothetical protein
MPKASSAAADHFPWDLVIPLLPQLIALLVLLALLLMIGPKRILAAIGRIKKIAFGGLEIELTQAVEAVAEARQIGLAPAEAAALGRRLAEAAPLLSCSRILWVDDDAKGNAREIKVLRRLCVAIDLAGSTEEAGVAITRGVYDLVISDIGRDAAGDSGLDSQRLLDAAPFLPILIYYVRRLVRPAPPDAFGITNRPDELFHLIVDALSRRRSGAWHASNQRPPPPSASPSGVAAA